MSITFCGDYSTMFCGDYSCGYHLLWRLLLCAIPFMEITPVSTTFSGDYSCGHYFYVPKLING